MIEGFMYLCALISITDSRENKTGRRITIGKIASPNYCAYLLTMAYPKDKNGDHHNIYIPYRHTSCGMMDNINDLETRV